MNALTGAHVIRYVLPVFIPQMSHVLNSDHDCINTDTEEPVTLPAGTQIAGPIWSVEETGGAWFVAQYEGGYPSFTCEVLDASPIEEEEE